MLTLRNWLVVPAASFLLSAAPRAARADENPPGAPSGHLAAAQRLYQKLDLDAAMAELKEAESDARERNDENEIVTVLIYKGLIFADNGKEEEMTEYFKRALAMRPWVEVPADTSPRLAKLFNDERKELWGSGGQIKPPPPKRPRPAAPSTPAQPAQPATSATAPESTSTAPSAAPSTPAPPAPSATTAPTPAPGSAAPAAPSTPAPKPASPGDSLEPPR